MDVSDAQLIEEVRRRGFKIKNAEIQKKDWVGLTGREIVDLFSDSETELEFARAIEAVLKEKNNG